MLLVGAVRFSMEGGGGGFEGSGGSSMGGTQWKSDKVDIVGSLTPAGVSYSLF